MRRSKYRKRSRKRKSRKRRSPKKRRSSGSQRSKRRSPKRKSRKRKSIKRTVKQSRRSTTRSRRLNIPPLKKGDLTGFGYAVSSSAEKRHKAVSKAAKKYGTVSVIRKLNVLYVYNKNKNPTMAKKVKSDQKGLSKKHKEGKL